MLLIDPTTDTVLVTQTSGILPDIYPTSQWQKGEQLRTQHRLRIPIVIPSEITTTELHVSVEPVDENSTANLTQGSSKLTDITVVQREHRFDMPEMAQTTDAQFGADIRLLGYDLNTQNNEALSLTLYWQAINTPSDRYTVFNHLINDNGEIVAQLDSPPKSDAWLTSAWLPGEIIVDEREISLPDGITNGSYTIPLGLYNHNGRLPVTLNTQTQPNDQFIIPNITLPGS